MINPLFNFSLNWEIVKDIALIIGPSLAFLAGMRKNSAETGKIDVETFSAMRKEVKDLQKTVNQLEKSDDEKTKEIGRLASEHKSCHVVLGQVERTQRIFFDELNIAYWEADKDGNCTYANQTFLDLTGLTPDKCEKSGWFDGVHTDDRNRIQYQWRRFIANTDTQIEFKFRFFHCQTEVETLVSAHGQAIYINGFEIHKYTARTRPLNLKR